eukprot:scaffold186721_cov35-Tisochrysis_lutea.AAC.3
MAGAIGRKKKDLKPKVAASSHVGRARGARVHVLKISAKMCVVRCGRRCNKPIGMDNMVGLH